MQLAQLACLSDDAHNLSLKALRLAVACRPYSAVAVTESSANLLGAPSLTLND